MKRIALTVAALLLSTQVYAETEGEKVKPGPLVIYAMMLKVGGEYTDKAYSYFSGYRDAWRAYVTVDAYKAGLGDEMDEAYAACNRESAFWSAQAIGEALVKTVEENPTTDQMFEIWFEEYTHNCKQYAALRGEVLSKLSDN